MASSGDKSIKFTFTVDKQSLEQTRSAIRQLTSDVKTLVETMSRAHSGTQGLSGLFGGISGKQGGVNSSQQATMKGGSVMTQGIAADARALSSTAKAGGDAIKNLTTAMRDGISGQVRTIESLKSALRELNKEFDTLSKKGQGGGYQAGNVQAAMKQAYNAIASNEVSMYSSRANAPGGMVGPGQRVVNRGGIDMIEDIPQRGGGGIRGMIQSLKESGIGSTMSALGIAAPLTGVGTALFLKQALDHAAAQEASGAARDVSSPLLQGRMGARMGGSMGQLGLQIRGGDLATSLAYGRMKGPGGTLNRILSPYTTDARLAVASHEAGLEPTVGSWAGRAWDYMGGVAGKGVSMVTGEASHRALGGAERHAVLARLQAEIPAQVAEAAVEAMRNEVAKNPQSAARYSQAQAEAGTNPMLAWTGGIGMGLNKRKTNTILAESRERITAAGFDPGAVYGANASLGGVAGRGLMGAGQTMLSLGLGGFGNAGSIYGVGAQFGGGGAAGARGLLNSAMTGGDTTSMAQIAGMVASQMTGGNFMGGSGNSLMQGIQAMGITGTPGGDMRMARMLQGGMGEYNKNLSGGTDALQGGINMLAANASGAKGWYAKKALMGMSGADMNEAMRSGKLGQYYTDQGLTMENVQGYNKFRNQYAFSRYMDKEGADSNVAKAVAGVKEAGGVPEYLRKMGVKANSKEGQHILQMLGGARQLTEGGSIEDNIGALGVEMGAYGDLSPTGKGRGRGVGLKKGTPEAAEAKRKADEIKRQGEFVAKEYGTITKGLGEIGKNADELAGLTSNLVESATDFDKALKILTTSLVDAVDRIDPKGAAERHKAADKILKDRGNKAMPTKSKM